MAQGKAYTPEQREDIMLSLQSYLELGFSRNKACNFIGLPTSTLQNWINDDEAVGIKIESWENAINKIAMSNIVDAIKKEGELDETRKETTKWWLERKMKNDFSTKVEQDLTSGGEKIASIINIIKPDGN